MTRKRSSVASIPAVVVFASLALVVVTGCSNKAEEANQATQAVPAKQSTVAPSKNAPAVEKPEVARTLDIPDK